MLSLSVHIELHSTLCTSKERTYAIRIVNIWPDLAGFPLLRGWLGINDAVRRNKPVARTYGFTAIVSDIEFQCSHVRKLGFVSDKPRGICTPHTYRDIARKVGIRICDDAAEEGQKQDDAEEHHLGRTTAGRQDLHGRISKMGER